MYMFFKIIGLFKTYKSKIIIKLYHFRVNFEQSKELKKCRCLHSPLKVILIVVGVST